MAEVGGETPLSCAQRAWLDLPLGIRRKLTGKSSCDYLNDRHYNLLYKVVLATVPTLASAVTESGKGRLESYQSVAMFDAIISQGARLDEAGDGVVALRAAYERVRPRPTPPGVRVRHFSELLPRIYRIVWEASADPGSLVGPDTCDEIMQGLLHEDPDIAPVSHSAMQRLFADPVATAELQHTIDGSWAQDLPVPYPPLPEIVSALLDHPDRSGEWQVLWEAYTVTRPWVLHSTQANALGLSRYPVPSRPLALEPRPEHARGQPDQGQGVLALDRSIRQRMDGPLRLIQRRAEVQGITTRQLAHDEARRAAAPLGIGDDAMRAVLCLGAVTATSLSADAAQPHYRHQAGSPRRWQQLARLTRRRKFVGESLRLGNGQHGPVRKALENPVPGFCQELWRILHRHELAQMEQVPPEARWNMLIMPAARYFLDGLAGQVKDVLGGYRCHEGPRFVTGVDLEDTAPEDVSGPREPDRSREGHELAEDVINAFTQHIAEAQLPANEALLFLKRFIDPEHAAWAADAWHGVYDLYRAHHSEIQPALVGSFPAITWEQGRDVIRTFLNPDDAGGTR